MCFVCSGKIERDFVTLFQKISERGDEFIFYDSGLELLNDLIMRKIFPDLILLEYKSYKNFGEFMYQILKSQDMKIPLVMTGSSCPHRSSAARWVSENEFVFDMQLSLQMIALLEKISKCIKENDIFGGSSERVLNENVIPLSPLRLPPVENKLLSFFYENQKREISLGEIENLLEIKSKSPSVRKNVVYSYIARLRKTFRRKNTSRMEIVRVRKGFYQLIILERKEVTEK